MIEWHSDAYVLCVVDDISESNSTFYREKIMESEAYYCVAKANQVLSF